MVHGYLVAGCLLSVIGSVIDNWGMNLQKLAHKDIDTTRHTSDESEEEAETAGLLQTEYEKRPQSHSVSISHQSHNNLKAKRSPNVHTENGISRRTGNASSKTKSSAVNYTCKLTWIFGFSIYILGQIMNFVSLALIDQPTQSLLSSFALFSNLAFARYYFNERFMCSDVVGLFSISCGATLFVVYFVHTKQEYTLQELQSFFYRKELLILMIVLGLIVAICGLLVTSFSEKTLQRVPGLSTVNNMLRFIAYSDVDITALAYAVVAAIIGGCTVTFSKIMSVVLPVIFNLVLEILGLSNSGKSEINTKGQLSNGEAEDTVTIYTLRFIGIILCIWVFFLVTSVHSLNVGLRNSPALVMIPVFYVLSNITSILVGTIYFQEYETFESAKATILCSAGISLTLLGIYVLARRVAKEKSGDRARYRIHLGSIHSVYSV